MFIPQWAEKELQFKSKFIKEEIKEAKDALKTMPIEQKREVITLKKGRPRKNG
jgi:hypothetical protein